MTIFTTPLLRHCLRLIGKFFFKLIDWRTEGTPPNIPKYVIIAAPHTSNWDFPIGLAMTFIYRLDLRWMGKKEMFRKPWGPLFRWLGGFSIDRQHSKNVVAETIATIKEETECRIAISPEGTRKKVNRWKTGFYHIAHGAGIPIVTGFLDYKRRIAGFGPVFHPTDDIEADIKKIQEFYVSIKGKH